MNTITEFTPITAMVGGALIGLSASLLLYFNGRVAGISGIVWNALRQSGFERIWRFVFIAGLLAGSSIYMYFSNEAYVPRHDFPIWKLLLAGLLVGIGTNLGSGCTSGHGICGLARFSKRSFTAVMVFMLCGFITTSVIRHAL
jgi:uncharacterized protein